MGAIWENKIYLILVIIILAWITYSAYELIVYIKTNQAISQFEVNLVKINQ